MMNTKASKEAATEASTVTRRQFLERSALGAAGAAVVGSSVPAAARGAAPGSPAATDLHVASFEVDATPPVGSPLSGGNDVAKEIVDPLSCRGLVLLPASQAPIVLGAVDWINTANGGYDAWRMALAEAAGTSPNRVAMHALHQHDAPSCDFDAELLVLAHGLEPEGFSPAFARDTIRRAAEALTASLEAAEPVTHLSTGKAKVEKFASNRRLLGPDGNVSAMRFTNTEGQPHLRELPEGLIDPYVRVFGLWNGEKPLASLSYYATHPQSYYGEGGVSCDTVGLARNMRQEETGVPHLHFNGAGGNIAAGKYNDRSKENRRILARRLAEGMATAWSRAEKTPVAAADVGWRVEDTHLPAEIRNGEGQTFSEEELVAAFQETPGQGARDLAWLHRSNRGHRIPLTCLQLGAARILHMPGELHIEYQLAAQAMKPDTFVAMAAYGDGGPGYIGTRASYPKGGYEVGSPSNVAPEVEGVLTSALRTLLDVPERQEVKTPSAFTGEKQRFSASKFNASKQ